MLNVRLVVLLVCALAVTSCSSSYWRDPAGHNTSYAVGSLRTYRSAITEYANKYSAGLPDDVNVLGGSPVKPSFRAAALVDGKLGCANPPCVKHGYVFQYKVLDRTQGRYVINASPLDFGKSGLAHFYMDETGIIRISPGDRPAMANDPPLR